MSESRQVRHSADSNGQTLGNVHITSTCQPMFTFSGNIPNDTDEESIAPQYKGD